MQPLKLITSSKNWVVLTKPIQAEFKTGMAYIGAYSIPRKVLLVGEYYRALCDEFGD